VKILLFGGRGQVGWELQRALSLLGSLTVVNREQADFERPDGLKAIVRTHAPDIVVNAVAYTAVDRAEAEVQKARSVNALSVERLAHAARAQKALLIHYSTDYVYDGLKPTGYIEGDSVDPASVYGKTKAEGDSAISESGCDHLIFRTSWVYASRGKNFVRRILQLAAKKPDLAVVADQFGAPTSAEMIADITALAVARHISGLRLPFGLYHLTPNAVTTWHEFACLIVGEAIMHGCELTATPETIKPISTAEFPTAASRPQNSVMDNSKLSAALKITLPDWRHHARHTVLEIVENQRQ
jgi:dTDP-4-dehydrorhamnose reductase